MIFIQSTCFYQLWYLYDSKEVKIPTVAEKILLSILSKKVVFGAVETGGKRHTYRPDEVALGNGISEKEKSEGGAQDQAQVSQKALDLQPST